MFSHRGNWIDYGSIIKKLRKQPGPPAASPGHIYPKQNRESICRCVVLIARRGQRQRHATSDRKRPSHGQRSANTSLRLTSHHRRDALFDEKKKKAPPPGCSLRADPPGRTICLYHQRDFRQKLEKPRLFASGQHFHTASREEGELKKVECYSGCSSGRNAHVRHHREFPSSHTGAYVLCSIV